MDWQSFNQDMANMAETMQQIMPNNISQPMMPSFHQPPLFHQSHQQQQQPQPQQQYQHPQSNTFISINQMQQPSMQFSNQIHQINNFASQMQTFANNMIAFANGMNPQQQNNQQQNVMMVDHNFVPPPPQIQNHIHPQQPPFIPMMDPNQFRQAMQNDVIDLTGDIDVQNDEEEKEEFVPWKDEDIPNEFKCPISLEIMTDPVICSGILFHNCRSVLFHCIDID